MTDRGDLYNSEGYWDPTPVSTLRSVQPSPGDIWTNMGGHPFLIISVDKGFCLTCGLMQNGKGQYKVTVGGEEYRTNPHMISFLMEKNMADMVGICDPAEMDPIMDSIRAIFCTSDGELQDEIVHLNDKLDEMKVENSLLKMQLQNARDKVDELQHDNEKLADKLAEPEPAEEKPAQNDPVNHPAHYTAYKGVEVIQITEQMNFCRGNVVKYVCRAGLKDPATEVEDLEKAQFYLNRELERLTQ